MLLVAAADGGYHPETGLDRASGTAVPGSPDLAAPAHLAALAEETFRTDLGSVAQRRWQPLNEKQRSKLVTRRGRCSR